MTPRPALSQYAYQQRNGRHCPYCVTGFTVTDMSQARIAKDDRLHVPARCNACPKTWEEIYDLIGFCPVKTAP